VREVRFFNNFGLDEPGREIDAPVLRNDRGGLASESTALLTTDKPGTD
jgi:hypothetical protein